MSDTNNKEAMDMAKPNFVNPTPENFARITAISKLTGNFDGRKVIALVCKTTDNEGNVAHYPPALQIPIVDGNEKEAREVADMYASLLASGVRYQHERFGSEDDDTDIESDEDEPEGYIKPKKKKPHPLDGFFDDDEE